MKNQTFNKDNLMIREQLSRINSVRVKIWTTLRSKITYRVIIIMLKLKKVQNHKISRNLIKSITTSITKTSKKQIVVQKRVQASILNLKIHSQGKKAGTKAHKQKKFLKLQDTIHLPSMNYNKTLSCQKCGRRPLLSARKNLLIRSWRKSKIVFLN